MKNSSAGCSGRKPGAWGSTPRELKQGKGMMTNERVEMGAGQIAGGEGETRRERGGMGHGIGRGPGSQKGWGFVTGLLAVFGSGRSTATQKCGCSCGGDSGRNRTPRGGEVGTGLLTGAGGCRSGGCWLGRTSGGGSVGTGLLAGIGGGRSTAAHGCGWGFGVGGWVWNVRVGR